MLWDDQVMVPTRTGLQQLLVIFTVDCTTKMNGLGQVIRAQVHGIYANLSTWEAVILCATYVNVVYDADQD